MEPSTPPAVPAPATPAPFRVAEGAAHSLSAPGRACGLAVPDGGHGRGGGLVYVAARVLQQLPHHGAVLQVVAAVEPQGRDLHRVPLSAGLGGKVRGKMLGLVQLLKYVTASAGTRPSAEIPDASCLRSGCHETPLAFGPRRFSRHSLRPHAAPAGGPPGQDPPLHELPQPDRARPAHDRDHHDLLPLPLQGPALQRAAQRLHALPPDSQAGVRPGRRREIHARAGLQEGRRLQELPRRPDPRQRRRAPRTLPLLPQPRGRPGEDRRSRVHAQQARHRAQGRLHPVPHAHPAHPRSR